MKSLKNIESILSQNKSHLFQKYPLKSLAIFGSYSRQEQGDESDLDIMVEFNNQIGIQFIDLAEEIEALVGSKIDLVSRKGLKDKYFQSIEQDLIYV